MLVLVVEPKKSPYRKEIDGTLESLQKEVDGYIEAIYPFDDPVAIICDEEGKIKCKKFNRRIRYDVIAGTFLIVGLKEDDFDSLTEELADKYEQLFSI